MHYSEGRWIGSASKVMRVDEIRFTVTFNRNTVSATRFNFSLVCLPRRLCSVFCLSDDIVLLSGPFVYSSLEVMTRFFLLVRCRWFQINSNVCRRNHIHTRALARTKDDMEMVGLLFLLWDISLDLSVRLARSLYLSRALSLSRFRNTHATNFILVSSCWHRAWPISTVSVNRTSSYQRMRSHLRFGHPANVLRYRRSHSPKGNWVENEKKHKVMQIQFVRLGTHTVQRTINRTTIEFKLFDCADRYPANHKGKFQYFSVSRSPAIGQ